MFTLANLGTFLAGTPLTKQVTLEVSMLGFWNRCSTRVEICPRLFTRRGPDLLTQQRLQPV